MKQKPNIYLDIDGVLLANEKYAAYHVEEFLRALQAYDVYWLTTHCRGDAEHTVNHLSAVLEPKVLELTRHILATDWVHNKTEAIDFTVPFLWFDDELYDEEKRELLRHDRLKLHVLIDLAADPHQLKKFARKLNMSRRNTK